MLSFIQTILTRKEIVAINKKKLFTLKALGRVKELMTALNLINLSWPRLWRFPAFWSWLRSSLCAHELLPSFDVQTNWKRLQPIVLQTTTVLFIFSALCDVDKHPVTGRLSLHVSLNIFSHYTRADAVNMCQRKWALIKYYSQGG